MTGPQLAPEDKEALMQRHGDYAEERDEALKAAFERERRISEMLQKALLTAGTEPVPGLELQSFYQAALDEAAVGGAFYDVFSLPQGRTALIIGTMNGKGLSAAAHIAEVKYALRAYLVQNADPASALSHLNRYLRYLLAAEQQEKADAVIPLSLGVAIVEAEQTQILCASAGEDSLRVLTKGGDVQSVPPGGPALGAKEDALYEVISLSPAPGDILLLSTADVWKADKDRVPEQYLSASSLRGLAEALVQDVQERARGMLTEDVCFILARRH